MGAGASALETGPVERKMSTRSIVQTNAIDVARKSASWTVQRTTVNTRIGFQVFPQNDDSNDQTSPKAGELPELSMLENVFPKVEEVERMSTVELSAPRIPVGIPSNFSFLSTGGHAGAIRFLSCSVDGSQCSVAVDGKGTCTISDSSTGGLIMSIKGSGEPISSCAITRDSKFVIVSSRDSTCIYDLNNGKRVRDMSQSHLVAVSDECDAILTCLSDNTVHVWDVRGADEISLFEEHTSAVTAISLSRKGSKVASGGANGEVFLWHYPTGQVKAAFHFHTNAVRGVSFSSDCTRLVSADAHCVAVWDTFTSARILVRNAGGAVNLGPTSNFTPDSLRIGVCCFLAGNVVAVGTSDKTLIVFEPNCGKDLLVLPTKSPVSAISTSWNGDIALLGDEFGNVYKLHLSFSPRDVLIFDLNSKPQQEKSKYD